MALPKHVASADVVTNTYTAKAKAEALIASQTAKAKAEALIASQVRITEKSKIPMSVPLLRRTFGAHAERELKKLEKDKK